MSDLLLPVAIVMVLGLFFFGCGYLAAFIVTRNRFRNEMIKRGRAHYNPQTGKFEWGEPPKNKRIEVSGRALNNKQTTSKADPLRQRHKRGV